MILCIIQYIFLQCMLIIGFGLQTLFSVTCRFFTLLISPPFSPSSRQICIFTNESYSSWSGAAFFSCPHATVAASLRPLCSAQRLSIHALHHPDGAALSCFSAAAFSLSKVLRDTREWREREKQ